MEITFPGTRGGFPVSGQTSCARVEGDAGPFVIDLGSSRLFERATWIAEADHVLLTHLHPDHIAHLASLLIARLNTPGGEGNVSFVAPEPVQVKPSLPQQSQPTIPNLSPRRFPRWCAPC